MVYSVGAACFETIAESGVRSSGSQLGLRLEVVVQSVYHLGGHLWTTGYAPYPASLWTARIMSLAWYVMIASSWDAR